MKICPTLSLGREKCESSAAAAGIAAGVACTRAVGTAEWGHNAQRGVEFPRACTSVHTVKLLNEKKRKFYQIALMPNH